MGSRRVEPDTYPPTELLNRRFWLQWRGVIFFRAPSIAFLLQEACRDKGKEASRVLLWSVQMLLLGKSTFSVIILAFFSFWRLIVISRREVLNTLYSILFIVAEVDSRTIFVPLQRDNCIGTHWRRTRRCIPVKGVNSVINFYLWLSVSVFVFPTSVYQFFFLISFLSI